MKVTLLTHAPEPERLVACAAKLCYSASDIESLHEGLDDPQKVSRFVGMLAEMGHESPIEHMSFTFGIEGVSRSLLAQITRHRMASFSVQSQRYVREGAFEFVLPPEIEKNERAKEIYLEAMARDQRDYDELAALLKRQHTERLVAEGYLTRSPVPGDRRKCRLLCTEKAWPVIRRGRQYQADFTARLTEGLSPADLAVCQRCLAALDQNLTALSQGLPEKENDT